MKLSCVRSSPRAASFIVGLSTLCLALVTPGFAQLDLNSDGFSDIWQQYYNAYGLSPNEDSDQDGFTNAQEAIAGTNPFSASDCPQLKVTSGSATSAEVILEVSTKRGKSYQLEGTPNLNGFDSAGEPITGTGEPVELMIDQSKTSQFSGLIRYHLWNNVEGQSIDVLDTLPGFPGSPHGLARLRSLEAPLTQATGYAGKIQTLITPTTSGNYSFFLSAGGPARLLLSTDSDETNLARIAGVSESENDIRRDSFLQYSGQKSSPVTLTAGQSYLLEVHHLVTRPGSHCQIAWTPPGTLEPQRLPASAFTPAPAFQEDVSAEILLEKDYDRDGQTGTLFPSGTSIVGPENDRAERINANPEGSDDRILFPGSTEHLYATWTFEMSFGHQETTLLFGNGSLSSQEGPRIDLRETGPDTIEENRATVRVGSQVIDVTFDEPYRVEIVSSLSPDGFSYQAGLTTRTVARDRFDLYVSDQEGQLIGSALGLEFRDTGEGIVEEFSSLRAWIIDQPNIVLDDWEVTAGQIAGNGFLARNVNGLTLDSQKNFFRVSISDGDQDGDGLTDWEEQMLAKHQPFLFFDSATTAGTTDLERATAMLNELTPETLVTLQASDTAAFERASGGESTDHGEITLTRTGPLTSLTVKLCIAPLSDTGNTATICDGTCCSLIGTAGEEAAEPEDYTLVDADGNPVGDLVTFDFGEMTKTLTVKATPDSLFEYPETLNIALDEPQPGTYLISETVNGASIQLFDLPDGAGNDLLLTGIFGPEPGVTSNASGSISATLNGPRTKLTLTTNFIEEDLTSPQQDSHVHKSLLNGVGVPSSGPIIFEIVTIDDEGETTPLNGLLSQHIWDLSESAGATPTAGGPNSKQVIIDSLFGQNGESPLYLNIHTINHPAGEIWAFLALSGGSQSEPEPPTPDLTPGSPDYPQLSGEALETEVRRFLNQATFGATEESVDALVSQIETARLTNPAYHRAEAYDAWIDQQMSLQQTYLLDYLVATSWQQMALSGAFDPALNPPPADNPDGLVTPTRPNTWPTINRDSPNPEHWYLSEPYPLTYDETLMANANDLDAKTSIQTNRHIHWQMMINARDQLRQKMGFALQQIVVVSFADGVLEDQHYGMANYQDQLNHRAFQHYRDVLGFANWSPLMGRWLSSLQNQKAADLDGDGENDIFPDENLARENMQLFSIGLFEIWPDGTLRLGANGLPIPTYTNDDIREFAKVLTGQSFSRYSDREEGWGGVPYDEMIENDQFDRRQSIDGIFEMHYSYPMKMFGEYHDISAKSFAGTVIDNRLITDPTEQGIADIEQAIDWLAGKPGDGLPDFDMQNSHRSTPAFISRRLIQRFVTSNPSKDYLHRVATVFKESEGNLGLTIRAILLDSEARVLTDSPSFGMKKSPLEACVQVLRAFDAFTHIPITDPGGAYPYDSAPGTFTSSDFFIDQFGLPATQLANQVRNTRFFPRSTIVDGGDGLMMDPMSQETVFNWYLPDYSPGGRIGEAGFVAPEFQLANEQDIIRNINYMENITRDRRGPVADFVAESRSTQRRAFGMAEDDSSADLATRTRIDFERLASTLYPSTPPEPTDTRTSESLADEILIDRLDQRLSLGNFKVANPYDSSDDFNPAGEPGNTDFKNRREIIIDAITAFGDPWDGPNRDRFRQEKVRDALYLLTLTAEFQIKK